MTAFLSPHSFRMRIFHFWFILFIATAYRPLFAQDSLLSIVSKDIIVTAVRSSEQRINSPVSTRLISRDDMAPFASVAEVISASVGVDVRSYGGPSGAQLLSLRGSTGEQVIVMINGIRLNSATTGLADLSLLNLGNVERIEVTRGGTSAVYGPDGVGGVINIITSSDSVSGLSVNAGVTTSSFNHTMSTLGVGNTWPSGSLSLQYENSFQPDSNYRVNTNALGSGIRRVNTSTNRNSLLAQGSTSMGRLSLTGFARLLYRQCDVPGTIDNNSSFLAQARQEDRTIVIAPAARLSVNERIWLLFHPSYSYGRIEYDDPKQLLDENRHSVTGIHQARAHLQAGFGTSASSSAMIGCEIVHDRVSGTFLPGKTSSSGALYTAGRWKVDIPFFFQTLNIHPAMRLDFYNDRSVMSPRLGVSCVHTEPASITTLRASVSKNFRAPTLNEQYWNGDGAAGNRNIQPERSTTIDGGLLYTRANSFIDLSVYWTRSTGQIVWEPGVFQPGIWSPLNLSEVTSRGLEVSYEYRLDHLKNNIDLTYNRSISHNIADEDKRLRYSPLYKARWASSLTVNEFIFQQTTAYTSERWVDAANTLYLDRYWLTDLSISWTKPWRENTLNVVVGVKNLFNEEYETISQFPGLAREFFIGFNITYHNAGAFH